MIALTLKHPWPWAIYHLGKRVENRGWAPEPSLLPVNGWFAIHGGVPPKTRREQDQVMDLVTELRERFAPDLRFEYQDVIVPGIGAMAQFGGLVPETTDDPWYDGPSAQGWRLASVFVLDDPVPCKGAQGLWNVPADVAAAVRKSCGL